MAHHKSALKRYRQSLTRRLRNRYFKTSMNTFVKHFLKSLEEGNKDNAMTKLSHALSFIDKVSGKGIIPKNTAARKVSRLTRRFKGAFSDSSQAS